jgi:hypothetical protein
MRIQTHISPHYAARVYKIKNLTGVVVAGSSLTRLGTSFSLSRNAWPGSIVLCKRGEKV